MTYREPAEMIKETRKSKWLSAAGLFDLVATAVIVACIGVVSIKIDEVLFSAPKTNASTPPQPVIKEMITLDPGLCKDTIENHYWSGNPGVERTVCTNPKHSVEVIKWWDNGTALIKCSCREK